MTTQVLLRLTVFAAVVTVVGAQLGAQSPTPAPPPAPLPSDALFKGDVVQRLDLRLNSADWEKLKQNFQVNDYYPADMVFNGQTVRNTGIRSRGLGSRSGTKPGLRVDFDRYATDQTFLGLKSIILDNLVQDPSAIRETVTMRLFDRLKIPAPREAHVRLYVNNFYVGLYVVVESIDKQFLARIFGSIGDNVQNDGYLFEFEFINPWRFTYLGSSLDAYKERFDAKTNEKKSDQDKYGPIETLVRLVNELPSSRFLTDLPEFLDLGAFMRYMAAQNFVGQNDGFVGYDGMNNFYLYRLEDKLQHVFIAWDEDNAFFGPDFSITTRHEENVLMRKAMEVRELRDLYYAELEAAVKSAEDPTGPDGLPWLEFEVRRQLDLVYDPLRSDPAKPYTLDAHDNARVAVIQFAQGRSRSVLEQIRTRN
ncbi:MAG: CotH kinase family protein [Acidobacteriota bacterium]